MISNVIKIRDNQPVPRKAVLLKQADKTCIAAFPVKIIIDWKAALERTMGDEQFLKDLLQEFIGDLPDIKEKIGNAVVEQNAEIVAKESRRLVGTAGNLGIVRLSDAAYELEKIGRKGCTENAYDALQKLLVEADQLVSHLQKLNSGHLKTP